MNQLVKDSKRAQEVENMRSNVDVAKHLDTFKSEMVSILVFSICNQKWSTSMCFLSFSFALINIWFGKGMGEREGNEVFYKRDKKE